MDAPTNRDRSLWPRVCLIVPNYNGAHLLEVSIPSLMKSSYPNFEIVVVDNGSSDRSLNLLRERYPSIKVVRLTSNKGVPYAFNAGMKATSCEFVSFLNNDIEVDQGWLRALVLSIQSRRNCAGCDSKYINYFNRDIIDRSGGAGRFIDRFGNPFNRGGGEPDEELYDKPIEVFHGLALFKRDLVEIVGGYDESFFSGYEETDLCWRLHRLGYKIVYVPQSIIFHMGRATTGAKANTRSFAFHSNKNKLRMLIKNQSGWELTASLAVYLFDLLGITGLWVKERRHSDLPCLAKALLWNLRNLRDTLQQRMRVRNECREYKMLFVPYSGIWRDIFGYFRTNLQKIAR